MSNSNLELLKNAKGVWPSDRAGVGLDIACEWAVEEIERLQGVVAKLPKCWQFNDDKTALVQTCPVVPGMVVWWAIGDIPWTGVVRATFCNYLLAFTEDGLKWSKESTLVHSDCFDSAAAAEFAKQAEKGT